MTVKIGKIVNTQGINGELRILSNSDFKDIRFKKGEYLYIDGIKHKIESHKVHKTFDIVKFVGYDNINDVSKFKNKYIYADELSNDDLAEDDFLNKDLIGLSMVSEGVNYGKTINVIENPAHNLLRVKYNDKSYLVPFNDVFINNVDLESGIIDFNNMEGLIDED